MKKRVLSAFLALCLVLTLAPLSAFAASFDDTQGHWGKASIDRWAGYGVLNGDKGHFNPNGQMTRAQFAQMLANMLGYTEKAPNTFPDVKGDAWFADAILKLKAAGVILGDDNGNANPNKPITRQEAAVMLCRAFHIDTGAYQNIPFADAGKVQSWAKGAVAALASKGMINGVGNNNFAPQNNINRASVAQMADNMISHYVTGNQTITGKVEGLVIVAGSAAVTFQNAEVEENVLVAPKGKNATVALSGTTKASDVVLEGEGSKVTVGQTASADTVSMAASRTTAEVAGKAGTVSTEKEAQNATVTVSQSGAVTNVEVAGANNKVSVSGTVKKVDVESTGSGANVTTTEGAKVENVTTNASKTTVSGASNTVGTVTAGSGATGTKVTAGGAKVENKSSDKVVTGDGKEIPAGKTDTATPDTSGGSSGGSGGGGGGTVTPPEPTASYKVSIGTFTGGTVSADKTSAEEAGETVTLTITPDAQKGAALPYVLKSLTVKNGEKAVAVTGGGNTRTFAMAEEGTYKVEAVFAQPITKAEMFIGKDAESLAKMLSYGYPENDVTAEQLAETPYLFIGLVHNKTDFEATAAKTNTKLTANGANVALGDQGWNNSLGKYSSSYVNTKNSADGNDPVDALGLAGSAYTFVLEFDYQDAHYTLNCDYTKPGVNEVYTVTFKSDDTTVAQYKVGKNEKVTPPAAPEKAGYTFGGWYNGDTKVEGETAITADTTITAKWTATEYTLTYNANGSTGTAPTGTKVTVESPNLTAAGDNGMTKAGHTFKGWAFKSDATTPDYAAGASMPAADLIAKASNKTITLYAVWEAATYKVTFKADTVIQEVTAKYNETVTLPEDIPSAAGKGFLGWYVNDTLFTAETKITANTEVTAKWTKAIPATEGVNASVTGVAGKLEITAKAENGTLTITIPENVKEKYEALTEAEKAALNHEDRLYIRVNSNVPNDIDSTCFFTGSTDNGLTWRAKCAVTKDSLNAKGIDVTEGDGKIKTIGQWFGFATVNKDGDDFQLITPAKSWQVIYRWTKADGTMSYTTFKVEFVHASSGT